MNRCVLLTVNYSTLAIQTWSTEELSAVLAALSGVTVVKEASTGVFIPQGTNDDLQLRIVAGSKVAVGDELASLRARVDAAERESKERTDWWTAERAKVVALQKEVDALKAGQSVAA